MDNIHNQVALIERSFANKNYGNAEILSNQLILKGIKDPWLSNVLAISLTKQKKFSKAKKYFQQVIEMSPEDHDSYYNFAKSFLEQGDNDNALKYYKKAHAKNPKTLPTILSILNLLVIDLNSKNMNDFFDFISKGMLIDNKDPELLNFYSIFLMQSGNYEKSSKILDYLIDLYFSDGSKETPKNLYLNRGVCALELGKYDEAKSQFIKIGNNNSDYNIGIIELRERKLKQGWLNYEKGKVAVRSPRSGYENFEMLPYFELFKNYQSVLLIGEQGIGDEIMFLSMIRDLEKNVKNIGLFIDPRLKNLVNKTFPDIKIVEKNEILIDGQFDSKLFLGSLGHFFRNSIEDFKNAQFPTIQPPSNKIKKIESFYGNKEKRLRIGLSWETMNQKFAFKRNLKLKDFIPIFENIDAEFVNLQYGDHMNAIKNIQKSLNKKLFLPEIGDNFRDLELLASKALSCDLIITIDNSTVHLCGSLNIPTFLLLSEIPEWRWGEETTDSLWYPSVKLYRKKSTENWNNIIEKISLIISQNKISK